MSDPNFSLRVKKIYDESYRKLLAAADRMFAVILPLQWAIAVVIAYILSPKAWEGTRSFTHPHLIAAFAIGGLLTLYPCYLAWFRSGAAANRYIIATAQMLFSVLLIHITGGRIETHFHIFGSLAFLAFYRDWRVLALATALTGLDHLVRGAYSPESVYGTLSASPWRAVEHTAWVLFEDVFLFISIRYGLNALREISEKRVRLEESLSEVETKVQERTNELRSAQQTLIEQERALLASSKMSTLGEMAGGIAHEINNPLATLKNLSSLIAEMLCEERIDQTSLLEMAKKMEATVDRIAKIVHGLRTFSRDGSHDPFERVNIREVLEETVSLCSERFKNHGIKLIIQPFPETTIEARATEISQVILNLLHNAYDAVQKLPEKWVRLDFEEDERNVSITITDSGDGIPNEVRKRLFQPFFTTKEIGKGTGLGLSISIGIAQRHHGSLEINENHPHTQFVLKIPKQQPTAVIERAI